MSSSALFSRHCPRPLRAGTLAVVLMLGLSACSSKDEGGAPAKASQVAAKVGDSEISVHQNNQVLSRAPMPDAASAPRLAPSEIATIDFSMAG